MDQTERGGGGRLCGCRSRASCTATPSSLQEAYLAICEQDVETYTDAQRVSNQTFCRPQREDLA